MCWQKYRRSSKIVTRGHTARVILTVKICIFERSNEKNNFSKSEMYFHKKTTPKLLVHIGLQNMKVGGKANFEWLAAVCLMNVDISKQSGKSSRLLKSYQRILIGAYDISFKTRQSSRNYLGKKSMELKWNQQFN